MKLLMISTDRTLLDPQSVASARHADYAGLVERLTVVLAGRGAAVDEERGNLHIIYPGGASRIDNFFRMLYAARIVRADMVTTQDPVYTGLVGVLSGKRPLQVQMHTDELGTIGFLVARVVFRFATCVRVVSERIAARVRPMTRAAVTVFPIFVDTERFKSERPRPPELTTSPAVLTVSRLAPEKRIDLVIRAISGIPGAHLYVVGDGKLRPELEALTEQLGVLDRVHFLGWVRDPVPFFQHADCFVQASQFEGYGLSLVEAVLAGCPAVSTDVGIVRELPRELVTVAGQGEYHLREAVQATLSEKSRAQRREMRADFLLAQPSREAYLKRYYELLVTCGTPA